MKLVIEILLNQDRGGEMFTRALFTLSLLFLCGIVPSCSKAIDGNNSGTPVRKPAGTVTVNSGAAVESTPAQILASESPSNPKDVVVFDGKNYIKKNGWKVPSRTDLYKDEMYDGRPEQRTTESGKRVITTTIDYIYKTPWLHSQDFYFEGSGLDSMKGQLESASFLEMSANGKVFFYSVFTQKVVSPPPSNNDPHEDPFRYRIMDTDGDGIFETLLGDYDEIVVPDWVLK